MEEEDREQVSEEEEEAEELLEKQRTTHARGGGAHMLPHTHTGGGSRSGGVGVQKTGFEKEQERGKWADARRGGEGGCGVEGGGWGEWERVVSRAIANVGVALEGGDACESRQHLLQLLAVCRKVPAHCWQAEAGQTAEAIATQMAVVLAQVPPPLPHRDTPPTPNACPILYVLRSRCGECGMLCR